MTLDLEDRLRIELRHDADRARLTAPEWNDVQVVHAHSAPRRSLPRVISIAAAVVLIGGGAVALGSRRSEPSAAGFVPPGQEFPLTELPLSVLAGWKSPDLARPSSSRVATVPGVDGWLLTYEKLGFNRFSGTTELYRCDALIQLDGSGTDCEPDIATIGIVPFRMHDSTSPSANSDGTSDTHAQWRFLPAGTAVVGYVDGAGRSWWQRPVGRLAVFPFTENLGQMTAYSDAGHVLQVASEKTQEEALTRLYGPLPIAPDVTSLTDDQQDQLFQLIQELTRSCLDAAGATYPYGPTFPVLPATADPDIWNRCAIATKASVDKQSAEWGGHMVKQTNPVASTTP
jgi:hypothetical protein